MAMAWLCCGIPPKDDPRPLIVDVHKVLSDEAWSIFKCSLGCFQRKIIRRSDYDIDVPMNYFVFDQIGKTQFSSLNPLLMNCLGDTKAALTNNLSVNQQTFRDASSPTSDRKESKNGNDDDNKDGDRPDQTISLDTTFHNGTAEKQTYQFKFSKVRTTKLEVSYQKGYSVAGKANFSIGLPKTTASGSIGLTAEKRLEIKHTGGQTFEEAVTMEATSEINVAPESKYVAKVQLEERAVHYKFEVTVQMSMPQKKAPIYIRRKSDNVTVFVYNVENLTDIFFEDGNDDRYPSAARVENEKGGGYAQDKINFTTEGVVKGNLACDHTIDLSSVDVDDEKKCKGPQ